jgi:hypothetical protein
MLKRVGINLSTLPLRYFGGVNAQPRTQWTRGDRMNQSIGEGISSKLASIPSGALHPVAWVMPYKAGAISSRNNAIITFTANGNGAQGLNAIGTTSITFTTNGSGQAVASAVGNATITFTANGNAVAPINMVGATSITFTTSGVMRGNADMTGISNILFTSQGDTYAVGNMIAVPISTELTADQIATAVWSAIASSNNTTGTMGEKLNDAGSASNPWNETLEGTYTAADMMRIVTAVLAGKVSGGGTGVETFRDINDTKDRVVSTVDSNGNRTSVTIDGA